MARFAISDIHGCLRSFRALVERIGLSEKDELFLLGDYIDRGPDSKGVIDYIWHLQERVCPVHACRGNHEEMLLTALRHPSQSPFWLSNGGKEALDSFSVKDVSKIPSHYLSFLDQLPYHMETEFFLLVHAGLNFRFEDLFFDTAALLWARDWYKEIDYGRLKNRIIIHGHTPAARTAIENQLADIRKKRVLGIDGGCVWNRPGMGFLCALNLDSLELFFQPNIEGITSYH